MGMVCAKSAKRDEPPPAFTPASQWNDRRQESCEEVVVPMSNEEFALRTLQYDANNKGTLEKFEMQSGARVVHSTSSTPEPSMHEEVDHVIDDATDKATTAKVLKAQAPIGRRTFGARIVAPSASVGILPGLYDAATTDADDLDIDLALPIGRAKSRKP